MLADFKGCGSPQTWRGIASPYGPPPWHMSGRVFTIWYRLENPDEVFIATSEPHGNIEATIARPRNKL